MFSQDIFPTRHRAADEPLQMPVRYGMVLPAHVTDTITDLPVPALYNAIASLMGHKSWERMFRIVDPVYCTPGWEVPQGVSNIISALQDRMPNALAPSAEQVQSRFQQVFPGMETQTGAEDEQIQRFDIVHVAGTFILQNTGKIILQLDEQEMDATRVDAAMQAASTRLLIFQTFSDREFHLSIEFGRNLVKRGGPACMACYTKDLAEAEMFQVTLLADLLHNQLLQAGQNTFSFLFGKIKVAIIAGEGRENLFKFDQLLKDTIDRRDQLKRETFDQSIAQAASALESSSGLLHMQQHEYLQLQLDQIQKDFDAAAGDVDKYLTVAATSAWLHESDGVVPLSDAMEGISNLEVFIEGAKDYSRQIQENTKRAPRVLNANFAYPEDESRLLEPDEALQPEAEYDLLVDVGPRWDKAKSIVTGNRVFPVDALPPNEQGHLLHVLLVSDDFSPSIVSTEIWLPADSGRSHPVIDGEAAEKGGPAALRVRMPAAADAAADKEITASGRLSIYYETNLLQSAVITVGVTRQAGIPLSQPNAIAVDYVLSGGFTDLQQHFATRSLDLGENGSLPVALNLTMNDAGNGRHRFIVKSRAGQAGTAVDGWIPYDPQAEDQDLQKAREELLLSFYRWNTDTGALEQTNEKPIYCLNANNGKARDQFKYDLYRLAVLGANLRATAFSQLTFDQNNCTKAEWNRNLRTQLAETSVIQVSHAGLANYVFPWALMYDIPLILSEREAWGYCDIINEEWDEDGRRKPGCEVRTRCKYHDDPKHQKNIICPYGFWGLKHIIEEPLSRAGADRDLVNIGKTVLVSRNISLSVGLTSDVNLDQNCINQHIHKLTNLGFEITPAVPAGDWKSAREMLRAPEIIYFLCHGEHDEQIQEDYLSIGPRDLDATHRIYNISTLAQWAEDPTMDGPDLSSWKKRGPLVFINGCHTADLKPGKVVSFASTFTGLGANGIIGTEISVNMPIAIEVAEQLFQRIAPPRCMPLGTALREVRWELANKGNILGLAYTLYGLSDLRVVVE